MAKILCLVRNVLVIFLLFLYIDLSNIYAINMPNSNIDINSEKNINNNLSAPISVSDNIIPINNVNVVIEGETTMTKETGIINVNYQLKNSGQLDATYFEVTCEFFKVDGSSNNINFKQYCQTLKIGEVIQDTTKCHYNIDDGEIVSYKIWVSDQR
jgi:hypothetical protein